MKKVGSIKMFILCGCLLLCNCSTDNSCKEGSIVVTCLDELGCSNSAFNVKVASLNEFELIRSQDDYDTFIDSQCNPEIDWLSFDLIAGMVGLQKGLSSIRKQLVMNCSANRLILSFDIQLNQTLVAPYVSFNALIPKLKDEQDFFVQVKILE